MTRMQGRGLALMLISFFVVLSFEVFPNDLDATYSMVLITVAYALAGVGCIYMLVDLS